MTILGIDNLSLLARENYVGEAVGELLKSAIHDSLVFSFVDRGLLAAALEEIELSLSGVTEGGSVEVGRIEDVQLLLAGGVLEEGDDFVVTVQLVDVETTRLAALSKVSIPKADMIEVGNRLAYEYVMANGLGITLAPTPLQALLVANNPTVKVGDGESYGFAGGGRVSYRISRRFKVSLNVDIKHHDLFHNNLPYQNIQNVLAGEKTEASGLEIWANDGTLGDPNDTAVLNHPCYYTVNQETIGVSLLASLVLPITRSFNVSAGIGPSFVPVRYLQVYDSIPIRFESGVAFKRKEIEMWFMGVGGLANVDVEYFVLPRLALNAGASYHYTWILKNNDPYARCLESGESYYGREDHSIEAFGLNPWMMTDGRALTHDLFSASYFRAYVGFSLYF